MNLISLLQYFKNVNADYEKIKTVEGFEIEYCWGQTSNIPPPSWKHEDGRVYDPKFKYEYYNTSNYNTSNYNTSNYRQDETKVETKVEKKVETKVENVKKTEECSNNLFDFNCNKELKTLIWCLIVFTFLLILLFIGYTVYGLLAKKPYDAQLQPVVNIPPPIHPLPGNTNVPIHQITTGGFKK